VVPCAQAGAILDVSGEVVALTPRLAVRVVIANRGDDPAGPLEVVGELGDERREARIVQGVPAGGEAAVVLELAAEDTRPGLHALTLLFEHPLGGGVDAAGNPPVQSQRAYLLLALGSDPGPAARIAVECEERESEECATTIGDRGGVRVHLESTDGKAHQMSVRVLTARGLRAEGPPALVTVPATGPASVEIPVARSGAPRGSHHGILVLAEKAGGPLARTAVTTARVEIAPARSVLPQLRWPLLVLALALLALAAVAEWRRRPVA
jgi:hypothetical protein